MPLLCLVEDCYRKIWIQLICRFTKTPLFHITVWLYIYISFILLYMVVNKQKASTEEMHKSLQWLLGDAFFCRKAHSRLRGSVWIGENTINLQMQNNDILELIIRCPLLSFLLMKRQIQLTEE